VNLSIFALFSSGGILMTSYLIGDMLFGEKLFVLWTNVVAFLGDVHGCEISAAYAVRGGKFVQGKYVAGGRRVCSEARVHG
jgi:hypothetical protein